MKNWLKWAAFCLFTLKLTSCGVKRDSFETHSVRTCGDQCQEAQGKQIQDLNPPTEQYEMDSLIQSSNQVIGSDESKSGSLQNNSETDQYESEEPGASLHPDSELIKSLEDDSSEVPGSEEALSDLIKDAEIVLAARLAELTPSYGSLSAGIFNQHGLVAFSSVGFADENQMVRPDQNTQYRIGSISKTFTSLGISMLMEQGLINKRDTLGRFYGLNHLGADKERIDLFSLVTHTSGLPRMIGQFRSREEEERSSAEELVMRLRGLPLFRQGAPGSFTYSNLGYGVLGDVIRRSSGQPFESFIADNVLGPLQMESTHFKKGDVNRLAIGYSQLAPGAPPEVIRNPVDLNGMVSAGGIYSSVRDMSQYGASFLKGHAQPLLNDASMQNLFRSQIKISQMVDEEMGYGWFVYNYEGKKMTGHSGLMPGYSSFIMLSRDRNLGVILLQSFEQGDLTNGTKDILNDIINIQQQKRADQL